MKRLHHEITKPKKPFEKQPIHLQAAIPASMLCCEMHPWLAGFT
jgi:hypothetical protein